MELLEALIEQLKKGDEEVIPVLQDHCLELGYFPNQLYTKFGMFCIQKKYSVRIVASLHSSDRTFRIGEEIWLNRKTRGPYQRAKGIISFICNRSVNYMQKDILCGNLSFWDLMTLNH